MEGREHTGVVVTMTKAGAEDQIRAWFDGWRDYAHDGFLGPEGPIARARTWLLSRGWRRHGRLPLVQAPRLG